MTSGIINKGIAKIYLKPYEKSEVCDEILYGMVFDILDNINNQWLYIETEYKYKGYVKKSDAIICGKLSSINYKTRNSIVINNFADVLEKNKIQSEILISLPRGAFLVKTGKVTIDKVWTEVKLVDESLGWIKTELIRDIRKFNIPENVFRDNLIADSLLYLGTQYRWGGKTPQGIDCSGLCSMLYMINGVEIYRDASIEVGFPIHEINLNKMKKGDLIFFPGHVAMYLGNNKYIHSSNSNNVVKINSLNIKDEDYRHDLATSILNIGSVF